MKTKCISKRFTFMDLQKALIIRSPCMADPYFTLLYPTDPKQKYFTLLFTGLMQLCMKLQIQRNSASII